MELYLGVSVNWEQIAAEYESKHKITGPHGWIQWKGTDVCMDVHCACGYMSHIDDEFVYMVRCPKCKAVYYVSPYVHLDKVESVYDEAMVRDSS